MKLCFNAVYMLQRLVASKVVFASSERLFRIGFNAVLGFLIAAKIGPEAYGELTLTLSLSALLCTFNSFGTQHIISASTTKDKLSESFDLLYLSFVFRAFISSLIVIAYILLSKFLHYTFDFVTLFSVLVFLIANTLLASEYMLYAIDEMNVAIRSRYIALFFGSTAKLMLLLGSYSFSFYLAAYAMENLILSLLSFVSLGLIGINIPPLSLRLILQKLPAFIGRSLPLFIQEFCVIAYMKLPVYTLPFFVGFSELGIFSLALSFVTALNFLGQAVLNSQIPTMQKIISGINFKINSLQFIYKRLLHAFSFALAVLFALCLGLSFGSFPFLDAYSGVSLLIAPLALSLIFVYFNCADRFIYISTHRQFLLAKRSLFSLIFALVVVPLSCKFFGSLGASISLVLVYLFSTTIANYIFYRDLSRLHLQAFSFFRRTSIR